MENMFMITILIVFSLLILLGVLFFSIEKIEKKLEEKINLFISKKDKELEEKVTIIKSWEKYIDFSIGDPVLITINLVNSKDDEDDIKYTAFIEARIIDLSKTQAKLELTNFSTSVITPRITKTGLVDYLTRYPWHNLGEIERVLTLEERREMQLNRLI